MAGDLVVFCMHAPEKCWITGSRIIDMAFAEVVAHDEECSFDIVRLEKI